MRQIIGLEAKPNPTPAETGNIENPQTQQVKQGPDKLDKILDATGKVAEGVGAVASKTFEGVKDFVGGQMENREKRMNTKEYLDSMKAEKGRFFKSLDNTGRSGCTAACSLITKGLFKPLANFTKFAMGKRSAGDAFWDTAKGFGSAGWDSMKFLGNATVAGGRLAKMTTKYALGV